MTQHGELEFETGPQSLRNFETDNILAGVKDYIAGTQATYESTKADLIEAGRDVADPSELWLSMSYLLYPGIKDEHLSAPVYALIEDFEVNGEVGLNFWKDYAQGLLQLPPQERSWTDYSFLGSFGYALFWLANNTSNDRIPSTIRGFFHQNQIDFRFGSNINDILNMPDPLSADEFLSHSIRANQAVKRFRMPENQAEELYHYLAGHYLKAFFATDENGLSTLPLYHDRDKSRVGINVGNNGDELHNWRLIFSNCISFYSRGDEGVSKQILEMISNKVINDISIELSRLEADGRYDAIMRCQIVEFLNWVGIDNEARLAIYNRIPGFIRLPDKVEQILPDGLVVNGSYLSPEDQICYINTLAGEFGLEAKDCFKN